MNKFNNKYYKKVKENFINKTSEEAWKEKIGEKNDWKNAWCDYCLRRSVGKKKSSGIIEDRHFMAFWKRDENETNLICNNCLAYLGWRKPLYKEKPRFFTYLGGKELYHKWVENWGNIDKFKKIEGKLQKIEEVGKYDDYNFALLTIDNQEVYFRHRERFPFMMLEKKQENELEMLCKVTNEGLEMGKIFSIETTQLEKEENNPVKFNKSQENLLINSEKRIKERIESLEKEINLLKSVFSQVHSFFVNLKYKPNNQ